MFIKIKMIIVLVLFNVTLGIQANDLNITKTGIFSKSQNQIISSKIKHNESMSYMFYFAEISLLGEVLLYEQFSQYKHQCYAPIIKNKNQYFVNNIVCFNLYIPINDISKSSWIATHFKAIEPQALDVVDIKSIIGLSNSVDGWVISPDIVGVLDNKKLVFDNLDIPNYPHMSHIFKVDEVDKDIKQPLSLGFETELSFKTNILSKSTLYKTPNQSTKMYLIKGDKVTLLDEKTDSSGQKWYFINYKGKKELNMWIKAEAEAIDVEPVKESTKKSEPETKQSTPKEPTETTKQTPAITPPKNAEITKIEKPEPIEQSASGSISLTLLVSFLGLLAWRVS